MAKRRSNKSFGQGMQDEVARQLQSKIVRTSPGREIYQAYHRLKSGVFFRPRYIIGAAVSLIAMASIACVGVVGAVAAWFGINM